MIYLANYEKALLKKIENNDPLLFESTVYILDKMTGIDKWAKIIVVLLGSIVIPIYVLLFQFILK